MTFEEWWDGNKQFFVGSSRPAEGLAKIAFEAGQESVRETLRGAAERAHKNFMDGIGMKRVGRDYEF